MHNAIIGEKPLFPIAAIILTCICLFAFSSPSFGQAKTITGKVTTAGINEALPGANVILKGTTRGLITDLDGKYSIEVPSKEAILVFSFVGYTDQEILVGDQTIINVALEEKRHALDEIVVIGYGKVKKSDLTGSVSSVKADDITKITSLNPEQSLQGKVTGVQVTSTSGAPGAAPVVLVRGVGTLNSSAPIFVVDGIILDDISFLNSADIASMEVLKDASATAIYGSRGANGVILVTTKTGKVGDEKTTFSYSGEYGIQSLSKKIDLLNGKQFATIANQINPGLYNNVDAVPNTDWQSLIFHTAPIQSHQFSISGATSKSQYYMSIGYFKQDGIISKSNYERISLKLNNTYNLSDHVKVGNNITISPYNSQSAPNVTYQVYRAWPTLPAYYTDGTFGAVPGVGNPLADLYYSNNFNKGVRAVGNLFLEATFLKSFTFNSSFGGDGSYNKAESFTPAFTVYNTDGTSSMQVNPKSLLSKGNSDNLTWLWENTLTFNKTFGKSNIDAVIGFTMQNTTSENLGLTGQNLLRDGSSFWYLNGSNIYDPSNNINNLQNISNSVNINQFYSMESYLARVNYTFDSKYILTATFRRDGSSKFIAANRWSNFPSFAAGWNISKENFMQDFPVLSNLKIRASWGKTGNEKIDYLQQYSVTNNYLAVFSKGDISYPAVTYSGSGNPNLKWETTTQADAGLEVGFFNNKLTGEFDYYHKVTNGILVALAVPGYMGNGDGASITYNAASVLNTGFEANLNWKEKRGDFSYSVGILGSFIHNEVLSIGGSSGIDSVLNAGQVPSGFTTQSRKGLPIGAFYGYKTNGVFQTQAELDAYPHLSNAGVGDLRFVNTNGGTILDGSDRTYIGSPIPTFIFGFNLSLAYKGIDFAADFQGQTGNKILNVKELIRPDPYNFEAHVMNRWTGPGTSNSEPQPSFGGYNYLPSDKFIQDGSFLRLRTLTLGYTLPIVFTNKFLVKQMRIYLKGTNIFTLTKFTGYTPEIASSNVINNGMDNGAYPVPAVYSFGINLSF
jgi:TonB-linked SusC/RagA family outer membrane protein